MSLLEKVAGNRKARLQFVKLYNGLCKDCQVKVVANSKMPLKDYCEACRKKAEYRLELVQRCLK